MRVLLTRGGGGIIREHPRPVAVLYPVLVALAERSASHDLA
jgi:hypothetical protein